jgi:AcrR family transcriptional regulator
MTTQNNDQTQYKIFDTALSLFREFGYDNVSIQKICDHCSVTRNAFYYYYRSKDDLLRSYFDNTHHNNPDIILKMLNQPNSWEKLWSLYEDYIKSIVDAGKEIVKQILIISISNNCKTFINCTLTQEWCIPLLASCQTEGLIHNRTKIEKLNRQCNQLCIGILYTWVIENDIDNLIEYVRAALISLLDVNPSIIDHPDNK